MKIKTADLTRQALDYAVSHCVEWSKPFPIMPLRVLPYSTDWAHGGPIIGVNPRIAPAYKERFGTWLAHGQSPAVYGKQTFLISAMRAYVASKLGDEVEIPEELL